MALFIFFFFFTAHNTPRKQPKGREKQKEYSSSIASHTSGNSTGRAPAPHPKEEEKTLGRSELWLLGKGELLSQHIYTVSPLSFELEPGLGSCCQPTPAH